MYKLKRRKKGKQMPIVTVVERTDMSRKQNIVVHGDNGVDLFYFSDREQLDRWCDLTGTELTMIEEFQTPSYGLCTRYQSNQLIGFNTYYNTKTIPSGSVKCKGLVGYYVVDCYVTKEKSVTVVHTPHPNVPQVFKPLEMKAQVEFLEENGSLNIEK
ncbi:hypothetical protein BK764_13085 [Bacillus thuringiensis serovar israelensis]|jgi:hypothetical protein|uniref:Uncharacterized protein n=4 Tax=Bacillus thuringiensis TaxID=1428 RepID=A0A7D4CR00_BACTU|nr:hypothetical protein ATN07_31435 [Bacillus thuringiensis serovar israelensis]EAO55626.1 hypothetical protein RBTH_06762 [Bacillus thuringiensis serovar israelensis ATCC 35646]EEM74477.1 hypothetical protein bthur0010_55040 [Bacillus thuringiensis serovar pondicheriensis BGSC 4BA1]EEN00054.1 hypothetical protein bthur0014_55490 [Bacillus thuringiensis IBL 4222]KAA8486864.1 hypothetical protein FYW98_16645 [Bacillus thuringiensis]KRD80965.1 hypothetical protein ASE53_18145 [Bacillus sp. Root1